MSKKDYINAVNEINVNETLKQETLKKATNTKKNSKYRYNKIYPIASLAFMCAIIMAIVLPNKSIAPINEVTDEQTKISQELPKVENFKNLYAMLNERAENEEKKTTKWFLNDGLEEISVDSATTNTRETINQTSPTETDDYSKTNIQVEGVDEADTVKTDGKYIYYLVDNTLTITNVENPSKMIGTANITFENENDEDFSPQEIFLNGNKVIVIGTRYEYKRRPDADIDYIYPTYYKSFTSAKVYNVENKEKPTLERTVEVEGNYLSSRMIGDNIYLTSNKYIYSYLCKKYKAMELNEDDFKPQYIDTQTGEEVKCVNFDCIYYIPEFEDTSYLNIVAFNVNKDEPANIESYLGAGNTTYSSTDNLYVTKLKYDYNDETKKSNTTTQIYKFSLKDATCTFEKTGEVPGSVLNQFSMDEKDGYFRIATTDNSTWNSENDTNNLYVLNENLETIGKIEGLAKGERIYSVRFMGNRAYMVTFVQTDPLFVIDLADPTNPTVLGELKIPGYSKYLHPYDETHLIGIGEDTEVVNYGYGDQVVTNGMKISLFDVTDPNNPQELYNVKIGEKGTYSELLYNHKALLFSKEKNIIAFPISITENDYKVTFQGAIVYGVSLEKGFELKTKISNSATDYDRYYSRNRVERIIYIKDTLFTLSNGLIKAVDLNTFETKGSIELN